MHAILNVNIFLLTPKPIPDKIPRKREEAATEEIQSDDVVEGVLATGGAAVVGYVAYRIYKIIALLSPSTVAHSCA